MKLKSFVFASSLLLLSACQSNPTAEIYTVSHQDQEGYYHAGNIVFLDTDVQGSPIHVGQKVMIDLDENGENPLVEGY